MNNLNKLSNQNKKVKVVEGLPKIAEGKGSKVWHYFEGKNYKRFPAKSLVKKEPFTSELVIVEHPVNKNPCFKLFWPSVSTRVTTAGTKVLVKNTSVSHFSISKHGIMKAQAMAAEMFDRKMLAAFATGVRDTFIPDSCLFKDYVKYSNYYEEQSKSLTT